MRTRVRVSCVLSSTTPVVTPRYVHVFLSSCLPACPCLAFSRLGHLTTHSRLRRVLRSKPTMPTNDILYRSSYCAVNTGYTAATHVVLSSSGVHVVKLQVPLNEPILHDEPARSVKTENTSTVLGTTSLAPAFVSVIKSNKTIYSRTHQGIRSPKSSHLTLWKLVLPVVVTWIQHCHTRSLACS